MLNAVRRDAIDDEELSSGPGTPTFDGLANHAFREGAINSRDVLGFWSLRKRNHFLDFECSNVITCLTMY